MAELKGLSTVLSNLNKELAKIRLHTTEGLTEAALVVKADSVRGTPIDLGNLRNSAYILVSNQGTDNPSPRFTGEEAGELATKHGQTVTGAKALVKSKIYLKAIVGYTANYAFWVHEMPSHFNFNSGSNQYLLKALMKNRKRIQQILIKWAKK